ncbi:hypothetical protein G5I_05341 [Acromyrmex echinatior]|uniref:Ig-like domain-containing protein n=1 Tax=Acromyrmex echinatior TaxID=103372 RepID=F4WHZ4_ACREC|nr:hypothetical protein G5I_05341 [Acromyrmex echinatior]
MRIAQKDLDQGMEGNGEDEERPLVESENALRQVRCFVQPPASDYTGLPPRKITIVDENENRRDTMVGPYMEGANLRLFCDVHGGKPAPMVSWYRNDRFVTNRTTMPNSGVTRSEIVVQNLSRDDVHSVLTCNATNNNRSIPLSSSVRVDMRCLINACTWTARVISRTPKLLQQILWGFNSLIDNLAHPTISQ